MLALLYDVHGNLPALEAVLADCQAERYLLGGDYAVAGAWPGETVALLDSLDRAEWQHAARGRRTRGDHRSTGGQSVRGPLRDAG